MSNYRVDADVDFNEVNERVRAEIRHTVNALTLKLQRTIQEDMLTGQRLNVQSGRLRGSVSSKVEEDKDWIEGTVGAGGALVPYAFAHEFGLKGTMAIKAYLRTIKKVFGRPITPRQVMIERILVKQIFVNAVLCVIHWMRWRRLCRRILMLQLKGD